MKKYDGSWLRLTTNKEGKSLATQGGDQEHRHSILFKKWLYHSDVSHKSGWNELEKPKSVKYPEMVVQPRAGLTRLRVRG